MVGRDDDLAEACRRTLGAAERLITITGPVGVGKSRLTIAMAAALAEEDGLSVYVVDLATVVDRTGLAAAVIEHLGISTATPPTLGGLGAAFPQTELLLVLDRCDQLRAEIAELATTVLASSPRARVVVTSREPLHIYGEQLLAVRPLPVPDVASDQTASELLELPSVALFIQRLANVRPFFRLTDSNRGIVAELCAQLDGLPLAIEQAAAQLKVVQPQTLLSRLQESIEILDGAANASPVHSASLPAALADHVAELPPEARALLTRLAVVNGEFRLQDVEAVADAPTGHAQHLLEVLVDRNLVEVCESAGDDLRLRLLHTTRTFVRGLPAADREQTTRLYVDRLVADVTKRAGGHLEPLGGPAGSPAEQEDLSAGFAYLRRTGRAEDALRNAASLVPHFVARGDCTQGLAGHRSVPAAPDPGDGREPTGTALTARQREVAELVSQGLTNREIARRLGIAEWTAVNHVRHLLRKLQFTSRVQVARWVARQPAVNHPHPPAESRS
ncbi:ATP-binding protein [Salinispora vitiensis]|uniref:ATP-binding protein n=1 Tax=Salinispora vitiensis TaxID=999544 RepID=UPI0003792EBC|nr:LuxR C-terminal-related transcriptional regulator [Salinispora vitiensis]